MVGIGELYHSRTSITTAVAKADSVVSKGSPISQRSHEDIDAFFKINRKAVGVSVFTVDLQKNTRKIIFTRMVDYWSTDASPIYTAADVGEYPLFLSNSETMNTITVTLLNGSFVCFPAKESTLYRYQPTMVPDKVTEACSVPIPPTYGKFSGVLTAYVLSPHTAADIDSIHIGMKNLSLSIYQRDLR